MVGRATPGRALTAPACSVESRAQPADTLIVDAPPASPRVAVLLPCFNEAVTIGKVVRDFRAALPEAVVYVFDNNSTDDTGRLAAEAGGVVVTSRRQGKGHVVQHMFATVDADIYVMADGDDTYPAAQAPALIALIEGGGADMAVGSRLGQHADKAFRPFHLLGNHLVSGLLSFLFGTRVTDVLSGFRAFSKDFVETIPIAAGGFGIETEMTMSALSKGFVVSEHAIAYGERPEGSVSKLNTWSDGVVVVSALVTLFKDYKPLSFFGALAACLTLLTLFAGALPVMDYVRHQFVYHVPLAVLAASLGLLAALTLAVGLILNTLARYHLETFHLLRRLRARERHVR